MLGAMSPVRILHAHSTFGHGGKEARAVQLMNAFSGAAEHVVISASPGELGARKAIAAAVKADFPGDAPPLTGLPGLPRLFRLARYMRRFDLVLTYNWGAFDAVMARYLFARGMSLPPLIHHEDGFNQDEAAELKTRRNLYRRLGLGAAHQLVVPSARLEAIARKAWAQPPGKVVRIANGIDVRRYAAPPAQEIPGLEKRSGEVVIGTVAGLRAVKNLPRLVRAFAAMASPGARLVIVGAGPESERIAVEARRLGVGDRLLMPGFLADPALWIGRFDLV
ncbi:MAG TPA: glycosyltransferase, partial [Allosphingosinicella sp.]|nr:glycosyltransferase [Allosphingosinicella sp.]